MNLKNWYYIYLENYFALYIHTRGRHRDSLGAGRLGDRINVKVKYSASVHTGRPRGPLRLL